MLDCHCVIGRLLMGSFPQPGSSVRRVAQVLVFCAKELQPYSRDYPGVQVFHAPFDDTPNPPTIEEWRTVKKAAKQVRLSLDVGKTCLVTCHMGLNRSGLVCALALMYPAARGRVMWLSDQTPSCLTSTQAIGLVRKARGEYALTNEHFIRLLWRLDGMCGGGRVRPFNMEKMLPPF